jgi:hypothetical protein
VGITGPPANAPAPATGKPPQTRVAKAPPRISRSRRARFVLGPGDAEFWCALDAGPWRPCERSPVYRGLAPGRHRFQASAVAPGLPLADPTPAQWSWRIVDPAKRRR